MEELHVKRSNAGPIQDDEDETRRKEEQVSAMSTCFMSLFSGSECEYVNLLISFRRGAARPAPKRFRKHSFLFVTF